LTITGQHAVLRDLTMTGSKLWCSGADPQDNDHVPKQYAQDNKFLNCTINLVPDVSGHIVYFQTPLRDTLERCRITAESVDATTGDARIVGFYDCRYFIHQASSYDITNNDEACQYA